MIYNEREIARRFGARQRRHNVTRAETTLVSELVYSRPGDAHLRRVTLQGYDTQSADLAAEMS